MSTIVSISGSPSNTSRTDGVLSHVDRRLLGAGHEVHRLVLRELPAGPLLAGDISDPDIAAAIDLLIAADGVVLGSPVYKAAYSGLTKVFLDLLPQFAFRGKSVLPVLTGGTPAHVLALDYALRPVLTSLGASHVGQGWFVLADHIRLFDDGGVLLDPKASAPLFEVTDAFLAQLEPATRPGPAGSLGPTTAPGPPPAADGEPIEVRAVGADDVALGPLLADLVVEYGTRYNRVSPNTQLSEVPLSDFERDNGGIFVILTQGGETIAGGALRRYDAHTAEVKRVWTSNRHRRRGLARRVMTELESAAAGLGYDRLYLTTGPRQPEAKELYLAVGFVPQFDLDDDPETIGPLPFLKRLSVVDPGEPEVPIQRQLVRPGTPLAGARR